MISAQANSQSRKASITLTVPQWILAIAKLVDYGKVAAMQKTKEAGEGLIAKKPKLNLNFKISDKVSDIFKNLVAFVKVHKKAAVFALIIVVGLTFAGISKSRANLKSEALVGTETSSSAQVVVNKSFDVPIKNSDGKPTGQDLKITITSVGESDSILIQNKPAKTKNGKTFLLINMEIQNDTKSELKIKPVDMVRLVGTDGKTYAADVYNNDVSAEAVSLRKTRIGYVVDKSQRTFRLLIGEVRGEQSPIDVNF